MVLCKPTRIGSASVSRFQFLLSWSTLPTSNFSEGINYTSYENNFIIQYSSWSKSYRILVKSNKGSFQIASSEDKQEISKDWKLIIEEFAKEVQHVGTSAFSDHHLQFFFENLFSIHCKSEVEKSNLDSKIIGDSETSELLKAIEELKPKSEILKLIQESSNSQLSAKNKQGLSPLHFLCSDPSESKDSVELVKSLINKGALVNAKDGDGWTPLHSSCQSGNLQVSLLLLKNGANVLSPTRDFTLPACYLVRHSFTDNSHTELQIKILEMMIDSGVSVNSQNSTGNSLLHHAAVLEVKK